MQCYVHAVHDAVHVVAAQYYTLWSSSSTTASNTTASNTTTSTTTARYTTAGNTSASGSTAVATAMTLLVNRAWAYFVQQ
eukprot:2661-Heterococcus_DN1.PRE.2